MLLMALVGSVVGSAIGAFAAVWIKMSVQERRAERKGKRMELEAPMSFKRKYPLDRWSPRLDL